MPKHAHSLLIAPLLAALLTGCHSSPTYPMAQDHEAVNRAAVALPLVDSREQAIIRQHTLYPYHFVQDSAELNTLGNRCVEVLGPHRAKHAGPVNVRRGDEPQALYDRRVQAVLDALVKSGVQRETVVIGDGLPGGDGLVAHEALYVHRRLREHNSNSGDMNQRPDVMTNTTAGGQD